MCGCWQVRTARHMYCVAGKVTWSDNRGVQTRLGRIQVSLISVLACSVVNMASDIRKSEI